MKLLVGNESFLSLLDPVLVCLELLQALLFQFALLLLFKIEHNLVVFLTFQDLFLTINFILKCLFELFRLALVESLLHLNTLVLNLLLVHIVLKVVPLLIQLLLDRLHSILILALKLFTLSHIL